MRREMLTNVRLSCGKTQKEVARDLKLSTIYIRKLETGNSKPGRETMLKLENYYGVSMRELFPDIFLRVDDTNGIEKLHRISSRLYG